MTNPLPKAIAESELKIGNLILKCAVLDNGVRVIEQESMLKFLAWMAGDTMSAEDCRRVACWIKGVEAK